jgi:transcriptional regulator GlxA family with amidase domain
VAGQDVRAALPGAGQQRVQVGSDGEAALARQINLSERHFTRVFKAEVGITAADHVETLRLESACRLLETTGSSIEQIARTCGFGTPETMNRTFRRRLNTTPGEHREHFRTT